MHRCAAKWLSLQNAGMFITGSYTELQWSLTACILVPKPKPELKLQSLMSLTSDILEQRPRNTQIQKLISSGASCV